MKQHANAKPHLDNQFILETERQLLLELGNDITRVRDKNDLIVLFSKRIKALFHFTHTIVTLIDRKDQTYYPFLLDQQASAIKDHPEYGNMIRSRFTLAEPFIEAVLAADEPVAFRLDEVMHGPQSPAFLRVNFEKGIQYVLMATLRTGDQPLGFLHIYSDWDEGFSPAFKDVIRRISPQLSSAAANIIKNEEIFKKEREKSFLLDFSNDITAVRTREELSVVVRTALRKLTPDGGYVIRKINADQTTMSAYLYDPGTSSFEKALLERVLSEKYPINDGLQNRILDSYIPLLFNVAREVQRGYALSYLDLWENMGFKTMVGIALRNGNTNIGLLWLSINEVNIPILQGLCSQIAIAMGNIMANEDILRRQAEQALMLEFSTDMTGVKTKMDLDYATSKTLRRLFNTRIAVLYLLTDDQTTLKPYLFDSQFFDEEDVREREDFYSLDSQEHHARLVLESPQPLLINIDQAIEAKCLKLAVAYLCRSVATGRPKNGAIMDARGSNQRTTLTGHLRPDRNRRIQCAGQRTDSKPEKTTGR